MRRAIVFCFSLFLLCAVYAAAETPLVPLGPAVPVNSSADHGTGGYEAPAPALAPDGDLLLVWAGPDFFTSSVLVRRFDAAGKPGPAETVLAAGPGRQAPRIIPFGPDRFLTVWSNIIPPPSIGPRRTVGAAGTLSALLLDATGAPRGLEVQIDTSGQGAGEPLLAPLAGGGAVAVWESGHLAGRLLNAAGQPVGTEIDIAPGCQARTVALSGVSGGGFLALWMGTSDSPFSSCAGLHGRLFGADGKPIGSNVFQIPYSSAIGMAPNGTFLALAVTAIDTSLELRATLYRVDGLPLGTRTLVTGEAGQPLPVAVGVDDAGRFLALWTTTAPDTGTVLHGRLLDANGIPAGDPFVAGYRADGQPLAARATGQGGEWAVTWTGGPSSLLVRRFGLCSGLCLNGSRFTVTVDWTNPRDGSTGSGHALPLTADTGSFWFFDPRNVELDVKVLDGRGVNGHFWVFYASLTDVEFTLKVTDLETGAEKTYHNQPYTLASQADVTAF